MRRAATSELALALALTLATFSLLLGSATPADAAVLRVGSYGGIPGQYSTIQAAVDVAHAGDTILIGPGDYKTSSIESVSSSGKTYPAAVLIQTGDLTLRGMERSAVVIDGTRPGSTECSSQPADQNYGPGGTAGLNGVMVYQANNVSLENMTVCNFLTGPGGSSGNEGGAGTAYITGNGFWWNGGYDSGNIGGYGFTGSYLTATSTFFNGSVPASQAESTAAQYGIYSSNWSGGTWEQTYASNMNDSGYYIGACQFVCDQTIDHAWAEYNALGYSGTNSGGSLMVENSQFDNNEDGFDTNSQNGDNPPPQDGMCLGGAISPITHTHSCWVFMDNYVHDNNNANVPTAGEAAAGPVGTGMSLTGARNDTVMDNTFANNGAWGTILVPYPDSGDPCTGGQPNNLILGPGSCLYDEYGNALIDNKYVNDGFFGNPSNGAFDQFNVDGQEPSNCFRGNTQDGGVLTGVAAVLQSADPSCDVTSALPNLNPIFLLESSCDSQIALLAGVSAPCLPTDSYPRHTGVVMHPLPPGLATMPNPCAGMAPNPWCIGQVTAVRRCVAGRRLRVPLTLDPLERFRSISVRVGRGRIMTRRARGKGTVVTVKLGRRGRPMVAFLERITAAGHREMVAFTLVYRRC